MARRNSWMDDLAKGVDTGYKLGTIYRDSKMRNELKAANKIDQTKESAYSEEQVKGLNDAYGPKAGETWNAEKQGYENTATQEIRKVEGPAVTTEGTYVNPDATMVAPKAQYSLGGVTQDKAFTPDQIGLAKMNAKADIYSSNGNEQMAEQMRSGALTREATGLQISEAKTKISNREGFQAGVKAIGDQSNAFRSEVKNAIIPGIYDVKQGKTTVGDFMKSATDVYNKFNDGVSTTYNPADGTLSITKGDTTEVMKGADGKPLVVTAEHVDKIPAMLKDQHDNWTNQQELQLYKQYHPDEYLTIKKLEEDREQRGWERGMSEKKDARDSETHAKNLENLSQQIASGKILLENLPEKTRLELQSIKANINQSNASAGASAASTNASNYNLGQARLDAPVKDLARQATLNEGKLVAISRNTSLPPEQRNAAIEELNRLAEVTTTVSDNPMNPDVPIVKNARKTIDRVVDPAQQYKDAMAMASTPEQRAAITERYTSNGGKVPPSLGAVANKPRGASGGY